MTAERILIRTSSQRVVLKNPQLQVLRIVTQGPQGPRGLPAPNLFVGPVAPTEPEINDVWVDTTSIMD